MEFVLLKRCECDFSVTVFLIWKWNAFHGRWQLLFRFEASRSAFWRQKDQIIALWYNTKLGGLMHCCHFLRREQLFHSKKQALKKINFWPANWKPILERGKGCSWQGIVCFIFFKGTTIFSFPIILNKSLLPTNELYLPYIFSFLLSPRFSGDWRHV